MFARNPQPQTLIFDPESRMPISIPHMVGDVQVYEDFLSASMLARAMLEYQATKKEEERELAMEEGGGGGGRLFMESETLLEPQQVPATWQQEEQS